MTLPKTAFVGVGVSTQINGRRVRHSVRGEVCVCARMDGRMSNRMERFVVMGDISRYWTVCGCFLR